MSRHRRVAAPGRRARVLGALLTVGLVASGAGGAAAQAHKELSPLEQGLHFYRGKTLTWIVPGAVGGTIDALARGLSPLVAGYLHATVDIENIPAGNTIAGQDAVAAANPDGLTVGELSVVNDAIDVITHTAGLNFNPVHEAFIAQNNGSATAFVSQTSANCPYPNVAALRSANPPASELVVTSGTTADEARVWSHLLGLRVAMITGYVSIVAQYQGFVRGDGCITNLTASEAGPLIEAGRARALFLPNPIPVGTAYRSVMLATNPPTVAELERRYPPKTHLESEQWQAANALFALTGNPVVTQPRVAADKLAALRAAVAWAFKQPSYVAYAQANSIGPKYISPTTSKANYAVAVKQGGTIACLIEGTC